MRRYLPILHLITACEGTSEPVPGSRSANAELGDDLLRTIILCIEKSIVKGVKVERR